MEGHLNWGLPVAIDLFCAGLGAGALLLAVVAQLANDRKYRAVSITGAFIAPWPVICGVLLLVVDLGRPLRFWEMVIRREGPGVLGIFMFNPLSTMSIGTWLLSAFVIGSLVYLVAYLATIAFDWGKIARGVIGIAMLPIALGVTIYTGVLIAATAQPLWNTAVLPLVFVPSAIACGMASVILILALGRILETSYEAGSPVAALEKLMAGTLVVELVAVILFMIAGIKSAGMKYMIGPGFGALWWVGIIGLGIVLPVLVGLRGAKKPQLSLVISALVLLGGFFLRYAILYAGQLA